MSSGGGILFDRAYGMIVPVARALQEVAEEVKIAGSLRRRKPWVGDLELVVRPRSTTNLFDEATPLVEPIVERLRELGEIKIGGRAPDRARFVQIEIDSGVRVDTFIVHPPAEWGTILAIRTGPAELGRLAVTRMRANGVRCVDGHLVRGAKNEPVPTPTEAEFFEAAGLPCLPPRERDTYRTRIGLPERSR